MTLTQVLVVVVASLLAALIKSIAGMGYPIVLIPVLAIFIDTTEAIAIVALSNFVLNAMLMFNARQYRDSPVGLPFFIATSIVGAVVGAVGLNYVSDTALRLILAGVIAAFVVSRYLKPDWQVGPNTARYLNPVVGTIAGVFQGSAGISGPVVVPWFLSQRLERNAYIFAITSVFAISGLAQIVVLVVGGEYAGEVGILSLLLIPISALVQPLGVGLRNKISLRLFEQIVLGVLVFSAVSLIWRVLW